MITRRNWLLKCSILVNVAVLLYICTHVMIGNNTNNLSFSNGPRASFLIQSLNPSQQFPHISSIQTQHESKLLSKSAEIKVSQNVSKVTNYVKLLKRNWNFSLLNNFQINEEVKNEPAGNSKDFQEQKSNNEMEEENRFEIPTDQTILQNKVQSDIVYSDGVNSNQNSNNSELFSTQSNDLETRLK